MMTETRLSDGIDGITQPTEATCQPVIDLRDRPSPEILRVLAIGSPQGA